MFAGERAIMSRPAKKMPKYEPIDDAVDDAVELTTRESMRICSRDMSDHRPSISLRRLLRDIGILSESEYKQQS